jgi:hypothetical protein
VTFVPDRNGNEQFVDYFKGIPNSNHRPKGGERNEQCITRNSVKSCAKMKSPPFPIVSFPVTRNLLNKSELAISVSQTLAVETVISLCCLIGTLNGKAFDKDKQSYTRWIQY